MLGTIDAWGRGAQSQNPIGISKVLFSGHSSQGVPATSIIDPLTSYVEYVE
jgi:hypothetical protein